MAFAAVRRGFGPAQQVDTKLQAASLPAQQHHLPLRRTAQSWRSIYWPSPRCRLVGRRRLGMRRSRPSVRRAAAVRLAGERRSRALLLPRTELPYAASHGKV
jgi:hypothetical protein